MYVRLPCRLLTNGIRFKLDCATESLQYTPSIALCVLVHCVYVFGMAQQ